MGSGCVGFYEESEPGLQMAPKGRQMGNRGPRSWRMIQMAPKGRQRAKRGPRSWRMIQLCAKGFYNSYKLQKYKLHRGHVRRKGIADPVRVTTGGLNPARPCRAKRRNARGPDRVGISQFLDPVVWLCYEESEPGLQMAPKGRRKAHRGTGTENRGTGTWNRGLSPPLRPR